MEKEEFYQTLRERFEKVICDNNLDIDELSITTKGLTPEEAIGITLRKDYPILEGKEVMLQATYKGSAGQAFTSTPVEFCGSLREVLNGDIENDSLALALYIASMNAVMRHLGMIEGTIHCKNDGPEICASKFVGFLTDTYGKDAKVLLVGYQAAFAAHLSENFNLRCIDLNPENIGKNINGMIVEDGHDFPKFIDWADIIMCTGSTIANGSVVNYIGIDKDVIFYGTSIAGAAKLMDLKRLCFCAE